MKERQKAEALARMKLLGIFPEAIKQFYRDGKVSISEPPFIEQFEEDQNALVYLIIRSYTAYGKMDSYLYVSHNEDEWESDREDLRNRLPVAYTLNLDDPQLSELGYISIEKTVADGLVRIW